MTYHFASMILVAAAFAEFTALRDAYLEKYKPLWCASASAWWEASTTGSDAAFERKADVEKRLNELHADRDRFAQIKALRDAKALTDPRDARQLDIMYRSHLAAQGDPAKHKRLIELSNEVEQLFNTHRSKVGDKELTENEVREILAKSRDSAAAEAAWKGYMAVGAKVDTRLREMVKLRNEIARELGFRDYFALALAVQEIDEAELMKTLDELDGAIREPFGAMKRELDRRRAGHFGIETAALRPWHFADLFFQEAPPADDVDFDALYAKADILAITREYYRGLGLACDDILDRSDLYEKPGKSPHAFCSDLNREGDIRVLCNIRPNLYWADTVVHEVGHGVYTKYIQSDLPWLLRESCHAITDEGMAMLFGSLALNERFLRDVVKLEPEKATAAAKSARAAARAHKLIFANWAQVVVRFERAMYGNPDQDLGKLWWELKARHQLLPPPEKTDRPDYAAKIHVLLNPVYYQSYLLGELFAAQVRRHVAAEILHVADPCEPCYSGEAKVGAYLRAQVYGPGNMYSWHELTRRATGEPLSPRCFVDQFAR